MPIVTAEKREFSVVSTQITQRYAKKILVYHYISKALIKLIKLHSFDMNFGVFPRKALELFSP